MVVYHVQNISGKSSWKVNGTQLFWVVPVENFWEQKNITCEKVVLYTMYKKFLENWVGKKMERNFFRLYQWKIS